MTPPPAPPPATQVPPPPSHPALPPLESRGPAATPVDASLVRVLFDNPVARQYLPPGARPVGPAMAGQFHAGQSLEQTVQLHPGKCYTVLGVAAPTVQDLDVQLLPPNQLGVAAPIIAQDQMTGATAVLGAAPNCFHWALSFSAPMRVVMTATAGEGLAGAQLYER